MMSALKLILVLKPALQKVLKKVTLQIKLVSSYLVSKNGRSTMIGIPLILSHKEQEDGSLLSNFARKENSMKHIVLLGWNY